jgi:hypothetical protein
MSVILEDELSLENTREDSKESERKSNVIKTEMEKGIYEVNKPEHIMFLTDFNKTLPVKIHFFTSQGDKICRKTALIGEEDCKWCKEPDFFDKEKTNEAKSSVAFAVYNFNCVGRKIDLMDKKTKKPKLGKDGNPIVYDSKPIQCLVIKRGPNDQNLARIKEYHDAGEMTNGLFELRRAPKEAKKALVPEVADRPFVEKTFKKKLQVPQEIVDRYSEYPTEMVRGLLANTFGVYDDDATEKLYTLTIKPEPLESTDSGSASRKMDG